MKSAHDKQWLVRSSGVILGPYSLDELIQVLSEKKVAIIDEVRSPSSRWGFIREHPQFADVVQYLREQQSLAKDDTAATFAGSKTHTLTITETQGTVTQGTISQEVPFDENTPPPIYNEKIVPDFQSESVKVAAASTRAELKPTQYGSSNDLRLKQKIEKEARFSVFFAWILLAFIITAGFFVYQNLQQERSKSLTYEDYIRLAKSDRAMGNYERALQFLRKADAIKNLDLSGQLLMAPLLMVVENQNIQARRQLEFALRNTKNDDKDKLEGESLIALSYLREGQLEEAEKRYQSILSTTPDYEPAQVNLLEILVLKGEFASAYLKLTKLMKEKIKDPCLIIYRALVSYRLFDGAKDHERINYALEDLKRFQQKSSDYQSEVLLLQAALQGKLGMASEQKLTLREMISSYPDLTEDHHHNEMIHREILGWKYLGNICPILMDKNSAESVEAKGLTAFCSYQQGDLKTAVDQIEKASTQYSSEPILYGLRAFLLMKSGRSNEAKTLFVLPGSEQAPLLDIVEAKICETEKDDTCVEKAWKKVLEKNDSQVMALAGLAKLAIEKGSKDTAADYVMRGWLRSSNYRPILEIKDQLEQR